MTKALTLTASDGTPIIYDVSGDGPAIILLHGMGHSRKTWHETGYVERLQLTHKVVAIDIRGQGESGKPTESRTYAIDRMCQDILEVADACGVSQFLLCGFSYGGNIGRFLAEKSNRVTKFVLIGIPFGDGALGNFRSTIKGLVAHWTPILAELDAGTLIKDHLSEEDRARLDGSNMPLQLACLSAMLGWGSNEPTDMLCPTLWISGTENESTMASIEQYAEAVEQSSVETVILDGLNHQQEMSEIDRVFPEIWSFIGETEK